MLPHFVPVGTSVESFFERVLPEAHRALVPADASAREYLVAVRMDDSPRASTSTSDAAIYQYAIRGHDISVNRGNANAAAHLWLAGDRASFEFFLEDWSGPRRFAPSFVPSEGVRLITDPRVLKRIVQATGTIELELTDFGPAALHVSAAGAKKHELRESAADAVIGTRVSVFEQLLAGNLGPDEAIVDSHVTVRGKKLVAMQFAFALAPFFPKK